MGILRSVRDNEQCYWKYGIKIIDIGNNITTDRYWCVSVCVVLGCMSSELLQSSV